MTDQWSNVQTKLYPQDKENIMEREDCGYHMIYVLYTKHLVYDILMIVDCIIYFYL